MKFRDQRRISFDGYQENTLIPVRNVNDLEIKGDEPSSVRLIEAGMRDGYTSYV